MVVGAGTVLDLETARGCLAAGAKFISSAGLDLEILEFTVEAGVLAMPGALTPSEIIAAVQGGADFVKIFLPRYRSSRREALTSKPREISSGRRHRCRYWSRLDSARAPSLSARRIGSKSWREDTSTR